MSKVSKATANASPTKPPTIAKPSPAPKAKRSSMTMLGSFTVPVVGELGNSSSLVDTMSKVSPMRRESQDKPMSSSKLPPRVKASWNNLEPAPVVTYSDIPKG